MMRARRVRQQIERLFHCNSRLLRQIPRFYLAIRMINEVVS
jgi:hypothetical protein